MKEWNRKIDALAVCVVVIITSCGLAQDWPQWRGPNRDGKIGGFAVPEKWPKEFTQKWKVTVGQGDATPALVGDKLHVFARQGDNEVTLCLNASDGGEVWRDQYPAQAVTGAAARQHAGPRSSPAVANGKVVTLGVSGVLSCLDAATGRVVWRKDPFPGVVPKFFTAMSPIIVDGMVIAHLGGQGNGAMIGYDSASGDEKWRWDGEGPEYASPALLTVEGTKQVVTLAEKSIVSISAADGKLLWQLPFAPARRAYNAATPIVDGQTVIYTGAARGTKAVKIEKQTEGFATKELWSIPDLAPQFNTPVLKDGLLFGLSNQGNLFCINAQTGKVAWTDAAKHGRGFAAIVDVGSVLLALPSTSELIVFKPSGAEYAELARIKVAESPTYAHPVVAGDRVFVRDQDSVTLWSIESAVEPAVERVVGVEAPTRPPRRGRGRLYGDWEVKIDYDGRQGEAILSFSRDEQGNQIGHWISFWGLSELKNLTYEEGKLGFVRVRRNREGQSTTSKFTGTVEDGKISGILSSDRGESKLEGKRSARIPRVVGSWEMKLKMGERQFTSTLVVNADKQGELTAQWQSQRGEHEITDVKYEQRKLTFKRKSKIRDRQWESTFEGTIRRDTLSGVFKSERGDITAEGKRIGASLIGTWNLEVTSERGSRKQRLRVSGDMSGLYGAAPIEKVNLENDKVSFKVVREFGERKFEMSFEGKLEESKLAGELTTSRGSWKVTGKKIIRRSGRRRTR
jgi:outer membrane protein assembly factor BamB